MRIAPVLLLLAACGNDTTADAPPDAGTPAQPTYYADVEPILRENCVECHSSDPDRLAPFSLDGLEAAQIAGESTPLAFAVMNRQMPPYYAKNDGSCQKFHGTKWLTDAQIDTLVRWVNGDMLAGEPVTPPPPPPPLQLPNIDATADIGVSYLPQGDMTNPADDYRCFVVDPLDANDMFLTGAHVRPDNATVVHHVIVFTLASDAAQTAIEARDAQDNGPGYRCTGGAGEGTSFLTGWAPGSGVTIFPADTGIKVPGGRKLVIQMHYNTANSNGEPDRTAVDFDLAPTVANQATMLSVRGQVNLPPREVDALAIGRRTLSVGSIPSARVWGGLIHMHTRGTGAQLHVERDGDTCMLDLASWSFHWQHFYWYEQPFTVSKDETLRITCHYDTTGDTQYVTWGEGTNDEMCIAYLYVSR